jgi:SAM-dependent methyltransferase
LSREQRLVFGEVAEDYARERPGYPDALFDDVAALAGGHDALEVGAGTGKATAGFVARGLRVVALEPSPEMAAVGRRLVPGAQFVESGLEEFATEARFDLLYAAQSWHWVDPERGFARAHALLRPGGLLALIRNRPRDGSGDLRRALDEIYERFEPELRDSRGGGADHAADIRASGRFGSVTVRDYPWSERRDAESYVRLLGTHSNHRLLPDARRAELLGAVRDAVEAHGGTIGIEWVTRVALARPRNPATRALRPPPGPSARPTPPNR